MKKQQFVQLPTRENDNLAPKDKLIFLCLKRWDHNGIAKVPLSALSTQSGASVPTIRKIIKVLEDNKYIEIISGEKGEMNSYKILKYDQFEQFDYTFLDNTDLTFKEKAYMAATKQHLLKNDSLGTTMYSYDEIAKKINISATTVCRINQSLKQKDLMFEMKTQTEDLETGCQKAAYVYDLGKMGIVPILQSHEDAINDIIEHSSNQDEALKFLLDKVKILESKLESSEKTNRLLIDNLKKENKTKKLEITL